MIDYSKVIMGENAIHIPFNFVRQTVADKRGLILGQETGNKLAFGSQFSHVFVKGDMIFRPHLVIEDNSEVLQGMGASGIITSDAFCNLDGWLGSGHVLIDNR